MLTESPAFIHVVAKLCKLKSISFPASLAIYTLTMSKRGNCRCWGEPDPGGRPRCQALPGVSCSLGPQLHSKHPAAHMAPVYRGFWSGSGWHWADSGFEWKTKSRVGPKKKISCWEKSGFPETQLCPGLLFGRIWETETERDQVAILNGVCGPIPFHSINLLKNYTLYATFKIDISNERYDLNFIWTTTWASPVCWSWRISEPSRWSGRGKWKPIRDMKT